LLSGCSIVAQLEVVVFQTKSVEAMWTVNEIPTAMDLVASGNLTILAQRNSLGYKKLQLIAGRYVIR
jgi:hypothetical protein